MELSNYVISIEDFPVQNKIFLYSLLNGKAIAVTKEVFDKILKREVEVNQKKIGNQGFEFLINNFFVNSIKEETEKTLKIIDNLRLKKTKVAVSILTTTECNFFCPYCHEGLKKKKLYINEDVASKIVAFIFNHLISDNTRDLLLYFYGGEPLLNFACIENIIDNVNKYINSNRYNLNVQYDMSTNGYLMNKEVVKKLTKIGVKTAQITLDGPPEVHNKRRMLANHGKTFDVILQNIKYAMEKMKITIRVNLDKNNYHSAEKLVDLLIKDGFLNYVYIYADFVSPTLHRNSYIENALLTSPNDKRHLVEFWRYLDQNGIKIPGKRFTEGMCGNLGMNSVTIDPLGNIFNCIGFVGKKNCTISTIFNYDRSSIVEGLSGCRPYQDCGDCKFLPVCGGGCRVQALIASGSIDTKFCEKEFYEYAYPEFLKIKFKHSSQIYN